MDEGTWNGARGSGATVYYRVPSRTDRLDFADVYD